MVPSIKGKKLSVFNLMHSSAMKIKGNWGTFWCPSKTSHGDITCTPNLLQHLATYPRWCGHRENGREDLWASYTWAKENWQPNTCVPITTKLTQLYLFVAGTLVIFFHFHSCIRYFLKFITTITNTWGRN